MRHVLIPLARLLGRAQRRFQNARPGSVMVLVIVLLVLMALIGTAFMATARNDRYSAAQHAYNTQIDLLVQGVISMVNSAVASDAQTVTYASSPDPTSTQTWPHQNWLADRLPVVGPYNNPGSSVVFWKNISQPISGDHFESPLLIPPSAYTYGSNYYPRGDPRNYPNYVPTAILPPLVPTFVPITNGSGAPQVYPALSDNASPQPHVFLAASASGDGIADCGLVPLPTGPINGVTYYYGVRIVDNNSAVNVNTAWEPNQMTTNGGIPGFLPGNFFPANINLFDLLLGDNRATVSSQPQEIDRLNQYRFNNSNILERTVTSTPMLWQNAIADNPVSQYDSVLRTDFAFISPYDQLWSQLGRRLLNPGYNSNYAKMVALPIGESASLAYHFCLRNPANMSSPTLLESLLPYSLQQDSLGDPVQSTPYPASFDTSVQNPIVLKWFLSNLNYDQEFSALAAGGSFSPRPARRAILTARNPVSNILRSTKVAIPDQVHFGAFTLMGNWQDSTAYYFGDVVQGADQLAYACFRPTAGVTPSPVPGTNGGRSYWAPMPWTDTPTKINVNTGSFEQLWLAYWNVMALTPRTNDAVNPRPYGQWPLVYPTQTPPLTAIPFFQNSLRSGTVLPADYQMLLRAALAAVNTMDLRDSDDDVTSRTFYLPTSTATQTTQLYRITVFGCERQPYITEVFATNNNTPYVAVELHNPYDYPLVLTNYRLATIVRPVPTGTPPIPPLPMPVEIPGWSSVNPAADRTVPAHGCLVLASSATAPAGTTTTAAVGSPQSPLSVVPLLTNALGNELVLLRPRRADGQLTPFTASGTPILDPLNWFDETGTILPPTQQLENLVPVDSYDFTNLPATAGGAVPSSDWHYIRPSDPTRGKAWHFVYPGPYDLAAGGANSTSPARWHWTEVTPGGTYNSPTKNLTSLGLVDPLPVSGVNWDVPFQVNSTDSAGPNKLVNQMYLANYKNVFPFGEFARNGDILQVPYVGAYKIELINTADINSVIATPTLIELNSFSADAAAAPYADAAVETMNASPHQGESIGRFCPLDPNSFPALASDGDWLPQANKGFFPPMNAYWKCHWTESLFDYLTVQAPGDDYFPNVAPSNYNNTNYYVPGYNGSGTPVAPAWPVANVRSTLRNAYGLPTGNNALGKQYPYPEGYDGYDYIANLNGASEQGVGVDGLININTAPASVLALLPMAASGNFADNWLIAQSIVNYRDVGFGTPPVPHGPFQSISELNAVLLTSGANFAFEKQYAAPSGTTVNYDPTVGKGANANYLGDISPLDTPSTPPTGQATVVNPVTPNTTDRVLNDSESQNQMLTNISNMITTRSDSFTVYIIVQGWRNAGTASPELVVQRRAAYILDRSGYTPTNKQLSMTNIPTN